MPQLVMKELAVENCLFAGDSEAMGHGIKAAGVPIALFTRVSTNACAELAPILNLIITALPAIVAPFLRQ